MMKGRGKRGGRRGEQLQRSNRKGRERGKEKLGLEWKSRGYEKAFMKADVNY